MIIAISGKSGCGNSSISKRLAEKHNYRLINYTFREYADEQGLHFSQIHALAKKDRKIDEYIDTKQIQLAKQGDCIVGSRLAIWKLTNADLRVYLCAPLWLRAKRIATREHRSTLQSLWRTLLRDIRDRLRYKRYYNININRYQFADITINTAVHNVEQIAEIIAKKMNAAL